jgi:hypothetical protein
LAPSQAEPAEVREKLAGRGSLVMPEFFVVGQLESGTEGFMEVLYSYLGMFCGGESKARP